MTTLSLKVSKQLAERLIPLQEHLPEIIELGLQRWQELEEERVHPTPRQEVEKLWAATGLIVPLDPSIVQRYPSPCTRQTPVQAGGKPASQIIIEQRGAR